MSDEDDVEQVLVEPVPEPLSDRPDQHCGVIGNHTEHVHQTDLIDEPFFDQVFPGHSLCSNDTSAQRRSEHPL